MKITITYIFLFVLIFVQINLFAQVDKYHAVIPDVPSTPALVNDLGDLLTPAEEQLLERKLEKFNNETSNEIAVVTVESLGDLEVSQFANELGRKWDIGKATKRNGVLVLVSKNDRKINISPSDKLQGVLPDVICSRIIRENIVPNFKNKQYYVALNEATDNIMAATKGEFTNDNTGEGVSGFPVIFIILIFAVIFIAFMYFIRNKNNIYVSRRGYHYNDNDWTPRGGGFFGGGFGGNNNDDDGGGFGGFGGGGSGFDGGGASGSW
jgi:uncharacterized protein